MSGGSTAGQAQAEFSVAAFSDAIRAIYEAALLPDTWPDALAKIGALFQGEGAVVIFYSRNADADFIYSEGLKDAVEVYQREEWWKQDLHAQRALQMHLTAGDVFHDFSIARPDEIGRHPIYVDFFDRVGFGWLMSCVVLPDLDLLVALSVPRGKSKGPYSASEQENLQLIGRHVEQSLRLSLRIADLEASEHTLRAALDAVDVGIVALSADRRAVFANASAQSQIENLFVADIDQLLPLNAEDRPRFERTLEAVAHAETGQGLPLSQVLPGADGQRSILWALPLSAAAQKQIGMAEMASTLLLLVPITRDRPIDPALLRDAFSLTLGEARIAALIGSGVDVREAASALSVSEGTVRVVLKRIFRKLGINRQAELVLQLARLGERPRVAEGGGSGLAGPRATVSAPAPDTRPGRVGGKAADPGADPDADTKLLSGNAR